MQILWNFQKTRFNNNDFFFNNFFLTININLRLKNNK